MAAQVKRKRAKQLELPFDPEQIREIVRVARSARRARQRTQWRGLPASPPGTFLDAVTTAFRKESNIPLELPWAYAISLLSWRLVQAKNTLQVAGESQELDIWLTVLGPSGGGKTLSQKLLADALGMTSEFGDPVSAAAWLECLADQGGRAHWVRDEWGQIFRMITDSRSSLGGVRDYLLRAFDHTTLERRRVDGILKVENPTLVIFGSTVLESFHRCTTAETLVDGLGQRFSYLIAKPDPDRHFSNFPLYNTAAIREAIAPFAQEICSVQQGQKFTLSDAADKFYREYFRETADDTLSEAYFRRILWRMLKLAVIYRVVLGKAGSEVDVEDMRYAARATDLFLCDAAEVLRLTEASDLLRIVEKVEVWAEHRRAAGLSVTARDIVRGVRGITSTRLAKEILEVL